MPQAPGASPLTSGHAWLAWRQGLVVLLLVGACLIACGRPPTTLVSPPPTIRLTVSEEQRRAAVEEHVDRAIARFPVPRDLILAVIQVESRFQPMARSPAGAMGLMQLMPATCRTIAGKLKEPDPDCYDPAFNILAGTYLLHWLLERYEGDLTLALSGYVAGYGTVDRRRARQEPLPRSCTSYAAKVLATRSAMRAPEPPIDQATAASATAAAMPASAAPEVDVRTIRDLIRAAEERVPATSLQPQPSELQPAVEMAPDGAPPPDPTPRG